MGAIPNHFGHVLCLVFNVLLQRTNKYIYLVFIYRGSASDEE